MSRQNSPKTARFPMRARTDMKIEDLGYNQFFEEGRNRLGFGDFSVARVISESRGAYKIKNEEGEYLAKVTGARMFHASSREDYPAVGDWVAVSDLHNERAVIQGILPRSTIIRRKYGDRSRMGEKGEIQIIGANIDVAFVVESMDRDYNLNRFERYFAIAKNGGVAPAVILNKIDLISEDELSGKINELENRFPGVDVIPTSTVSNEGLNELKTYIIGGKTYCFLGSSGVGKSSLINKLIGESAIKTADIGSRSGRGKHVTTIRQMYFLENGGMVIDNPGMREVSVTDVGGAIDVVFDEIPILARKCKYADCTHTREPGCEVINAVRLGDLDEARYLNYVNLKKETEYREMNDFEKKEKDRRFGKFIKTAKKELKQSGYKD